MKPVLTLLIFLAAFPAYSAEHPKKTKGHQKRAKTSAVYVIERIRGDAWIYRKGKIIKAETEKTLVPGDMVRTGSNASARVSQVRPEKIHLDLSSYSTVSVASGALTLKYGAAQGRLPEKAAAEIRMPTAVVRSKPGRSTESVFILSVMRSDKELHQRLAGQLVVPPLVKDFGRVHASALLHSQVALLQGTLVLHPSKGDPVVLSKPGDMVEFHGSQADFAPRTVQLQELKSAQDAFRFPAQ